MAIIILYEVVYAWHELLRGPIAYYNAVRENNAVDDIECRYTDL